MMDTRYTTSFNTVSTAVYYIDLRIGHYQVPNNKSIV